MFFAGVALREGSQAPTSEDAEMPPQGMAETIQRAEIAPFIPFDLQGQAVPLG